MRRRKTITRTYPDGSGYTHWRDGGGTITYQDNDPTLVLDLQFARDGAFVSRRGPLPTFTRASAAWCVNSAGLIVPAAVNEPRVDYDPTTLACRGLLLEEQRTNLFQRSADITVAPWSTSGTLPTADKTAAPDGTTTADSLAETVANVQHYTLNTASVTSGSTYTASIFVKKGNGATAPDWIAFGFISAGFGTARVAFNVQTGLFGNITGITSTSVTQFQNGWWRISVTATATATTGSGGLLLNFTQNTNVAASVPVYVGQTTSDVFIWGAQFEAGSFATSYIPTTSASVVRSADVCSITGASFSSFFNATEGTLVVKAARLLAANAAGTSGFPRYLCFDDGTTSNRIQAWWFGGPNQFVTTVGGVDSAALALATVTGGTSFGIAARYKANDFAASQDGGAVGTDVSGALPTVTAVGIGQASSGMGIINGHIHTIQYFNAIKTNAQLQALSTP